MNANVSVFDYSNNKLCDLYDEEVRQEGQAFDIQYIQNWNGVPELSFSIPFMVNKELNNRWNYLKSEYLIRLYYDGKTEWFVASKPVKRKSGKEIIGSVTCRGTANLLKTKNIYMEFDDENGIGTIDYLMEQILAGTGWELGYCEVIYEKDGETEKIRSLSSGGKQGALGLITTVCNLFQCRPIYHSDTKKVDIVSLNNRDMIFEAEVGKNLDALSVNYNSDDIITRLYVEGEYGDHGYVGIDDVNPTGLTYLFDFGYYKEIGVFSDEHEQAYQTYLEDIGDIVAQIKNVATQISEIEDDINNLIGQCKLTVYYDAQGYTTPVYVYGDPTAAQQNLGVGDEVIVLNNDGTYRTEICGDNPRQLIEYGDYGIAKFATKAAGLIGAKEVQIEAKEKEIANLNRKINATIKEDKKAEYRAEIAKLEEEIDTIYNGDDDNDGLYALMHSMMKQDGKLNRLRGFVTTQNLLIAQQDDIEATFIAAMGDLLRDGCWQNNNYIVGQEEALYADALDHMAIMSRPSADYSFDYVRMVKEYGVPIEDIQINALVRTNDDELDVHENLFINKITTWIDQKDKGNIDVTNEDLTLTNNDLSSLLSRMSQLADLIDQKNQIYDRAEAISKSGTFFADRLNGQIDVVKNQILSTVSNWYTDDNGNIVFISADGGSAMMLSGAGFMLADSKTEDGEWNWRTTGTGHGLNADEITAGFISADRIESRSISVDKVTPNFGSTLALSGNPDLEALSDQIAPAFDENTDYPKNSLVNYHGSIYVFDTDHTAGPWDETEVSQTNVSSQIELLPDQIIQYVGSKGYSKTYIQMTDPTLDPDKTVAIGDYWIQARETDMGQTLTWGQAKDRKWRDLRAMTWGAISGYTKLMCWNGTNWVVVYDMSTVANAYTRIKENKYAIELEAYRANAAEGELNARITITADTIRQEVSRDYTSKSFFEMTADGKIRLSAENFSSLGTTASGIFITPNEILISSAGLLSVNSGGDMNIESGGDLNVNSGGRILVKSGADMNVQSGGDINIQSGGNLKVASGGQMTISSNGGLTINSGGKFVLTSTYFNVAEDGTITATGGKIGGFTIGSSALTAGSGTNSVHMTTGTWAFAAGDATASDAPFRVNRNGDVYIKSLKVRNESNTGYDTIDFTSYVTDEGLVNSFSKLKYNTVQYINGNTIKLSNGGSYNVG